MTLGVNKMIQPSFKKALIPALISSSLVLAGCGGSSSSDNDDPVSGSLTSGIITGFGSIYVNGIKFETDQASFDVDDDVDADQDDLRIGMRVKINGQINADGLTGTADKVIYENEVEGPVSNVDASDPANIIITILGLDITVNGDTTFDNDDNDLNMSNIMVGDLLEVSGFSSGTAVTATHIEKQSDSFVADVTEVEIKGEISTPGSNSFSVKGLTVNYDSNTELDDIPNNTLTEGLYVEVKGTLNSAGDILSATKIEAEDDGLGEDADEVELEGLVSNYDANTDTFMVQGQSVDASGSPELVPSNLVLADDLKVEVEGELIDGILYADEIKLKGRKIKIHAAVSSIDTENRTVSFSLFGGNNNVTARVPDQIEMEDDVDDLEPFALSDLMVNDFVELEAFDDGTNTINAIELDRKEADNVQLEGPVSEFDSVNGTVTMLGQSLTLPPTAEYENDDGVPFATPADFFLELAVGSFIELTDKDPDGLDLPDGVIDEVELEEEDDD
jgi:hypothetical protein